MGLKKLEKYSISDLLVLKEQCLYMMGVIRYKSSESSIPGYDDYWKYKKAMNIFSEEITDRTKEAMELIADEIENYTLL